MKRYVRNYLVKVLLSLTSLKRNSNLIFSSEFLIFSGDIEMSIDLKYLTHNFIIINASLCQALFYESSYFSKIDLDLFLI